MSNEVVKPEKLLLERFGIDQRAFERTLDSALERKADYADLYFEYQSAQSVSLEESMVNRTARSISQGVGVRVCAGDRTGYAYSDEVTVDRMRIAAEAARAIADQRASASAPVRVGEAVSRRELYALEMQPVDVPVEEKVKLLEAIDKLARSRDGRIKNVMASFAAEHKIVMMVNSEGKIAADVQPLCR